uniref:ADP-ribosylation factor-like protein 6-interacting protein 1 n=1 Tax=Myxine glutinosa TaxID=7769 RepID=UPI0035901A86
MMANETAKLEEQLQRWGEVLVVGDQVLKWDKPHYPAAIVGAVSTVFLFIYWVDPSFLTGFSCLLLLLCVTDLLVPTLISRIFGTNKWTTEQQQRFHELCRQLVLARQALRGWICRLLELRDGRPKVYLLSALIGLLSTAWIGYKIHNLLLAYLVVSTLLLLPGMKHHNIVGKTISIVRQKVSKVMPSKETKKE